MIAVRNLEKSVKSGAGKSTLLHILGMHDSAWNGEYWLHDQPVHAL